MIRGGTGFQPVRFEFLDEAESKPHRLKPVPPGAGSTRRCARKALSDARGETRLEAVDCRGRHGRTHISRPGHCSGVDVAKFRTIFGTGFRRKKDRRGESCSLETQRGIRSSSGTGGGISAGDDSHSAGLKGISGGMTLARNVAKLAQPCWIRSRFCAGTSLSLRWGSEDMPRDR